MSLSISLHNKALIVSLNISQWTGRKFDKTATDTVANEHGNDRESGNYTKKLLPGAKELAEVSRLANSIRTFFYENTLPWASDGARIIKSTAWLDFMKNFNVKKGQFDHAVAEFIREYPALREQARAKLGDLFRETEYPTVARLQNSFSCNVAIMPVPAVEDFRVSISDSEKDTFIKSIQDVQQNAMREVWTRLHDVVSRAAGTLAQSRDGGKPAIFRDTLIGNISELCTLLPNLNVMDDPNLEKMRVEIEKLVAGISLEDCRKNSDTRVQASHALDDIASKMSAYMGS
jgi:hypothetical protein